LEGAIWIPHDEDPGKYTRIIMQDPENGWKYEWLTAIYWAITTMTTIGYGDISAHNDHERIFCMIAMTLGSAYFAWLAGTVTGILAKGNAGQETFMAFLNEVGQFMDIKRFSKEIKDSVNVFYGLKYPTQLIFNDQEIMDSLPKCLRKRMQAETYMQTIETIPLFTDLSEAVKIEVCSGFETYYCSPEEQLTVEDEEPDALFVVRKGDVLLSSKGESVAVAQRGDMFGELGLLGLTETGRRLRTAVSISECELLRMSKENFRDLILAHGELRVSYRQLALRHVNNMAREAADPNSPIYDEDKLAYIHGAWQTGKFPDKIRIKGKVPPPVIISSSEVKEKKVTTQVNLDFKELKGLPLIHVPRALCLCALCSSMMWVSKNPTSASSSTTPLLCRACRSRSTSKRCSNTSTHWIWTRLLSIALRSKSKWSTCAGMMEGIWLPPSLPQTSGLKATPRGRKPLQAIRVRQ